MPDYVSMAHAESAAGADSERILYALRSAGADPIESLKALRAVTGMNLTEAKRVLFFSETWADRRSEFDAAERTLEAAIRLENWQTLRKVRGPEGSE
jgi:ribosomal protein L7/L12